MKAKAAARKLAAEAQADAERMLGQEAVDVVADPWATLNRLAIEADAMVSALAARVNALNGALRYTAPGAGTEQLRAEVTLYERAMDRAAKFADLLIRHDFEGKKIELAQAQALIVTTAFRAALDKAGAELLPAVRGTIVNQFLLELRVPVVLDEDEVPQPLPASALTDEVMTREIGRWGGTVNAELAEQITLVIRRTLERLELTGDQWDLVPVVVPEELRRLTVQDVVPMPGVARGEVE